LEEWLTLNKEYAGQWPNIATKEASPADAKDWDGVADKRDHFSPNPHGAVAQSERQALASP
jgi:ferredoxin